VSSYCRLVDAVVGGARYLDRRRTTGPVPQRQNGRPSVCTLVPETPWVRSRPWRHGRVADTLVIGALGYPLGIRSLTGAERAIPMPSTFAIRPSIGSRSRRLWQLDEPRR
jgi:hypothetical protein